MNKKEIPQGAPHGFGANLLLCRSTLAPSLNPNLSIVIMLVFFDVSCASESRYTALRDPLKAGFKVPLPGLSTSSRGQAHGCLSARHDAKRRQATIDNSTGVYKWEDFRRIARDQESGKARVEHSQSEKARVEYSQTVDLSACGDCLSCGNRMHKV